MVRCDACTTRIRPGEVAVVGEGGIYCTVTCEYEGEVLTDEYVPQVIG